jgi:peptidoglycan hydrolase-like protein with peptidoglycan-binding domain
MVALGFTVDVDGIYGPQSKTACVAFQRTHGLPADGIVGPATWAAVFAPNEGAPVLRRVRDDELNAALEAQATNILQAHYGEPFGTQYPVDLDGQHYFGRLE